MKERGPNKTLGFSLLMLRCINMSAQISSAGNAGRTHRTVKLVMGLLSQLQVNTFVELATVIVKKCEQGQNG
jgi:hypothetical protein